MENSDSSDNPRSVDLNGLVLRLTKHEKSLSFEIEDPQQPLVLYFSEIQDDDIVKVTEKLFSTVSELYDGIVSAIETKDKNITIKFTDDFKLVYSEEFKNEKRNWKIKFYLPFEAKVLDRTLKLENTVEKLQQKVGAQEREIISLKDFIKYQSSQNSKDLESATDLFKKEITRKSQDMGDLSRKLAEAFERISYLELKLLELNKELSFDPNCGNADLFKFQYDDMVVELANNTHDHKQISTTKSINIFNKSIKFKIESTKNANIYIGICLKGSIGHSSSNSYKSRGSFVYYGNGSRYLYRNEKYESIQGKQKLEVGDVIEVKVKMEDMRISWSKEFEDLAECEIEQEFRNAEFYFCVHLVDKGDKIRILI